MRESSLASKRGSLAIGLGAALALGVIAGIVSSLIVQRKKNNLAEIAKAKKLLLFDSAVASILSGWNAAQAKYTKALVDAGCQTANVLAVALREGARCTDGTAPISMPPVNLFSLFTGYETASMNLFTYGVACEVSGNSSNCVNGGAARFVLGKRTDWMAPSHPLSAQLANVSDAVAQEQRIDGRDFLATLSGVDADKMTVEFTLTAYESTGQTQSMKVVLLTTMSNLVHLEANGRVSNEARDMRSQCAGDPWTRHFYFDSSDERCKNFEAFASGDGLHFYGDRYFGFRSGDRWIVDLTPTANGQLVGENGRWQGTNSAPVHPPYDRSTNGPLVGADDLTLIGRQIYLAAGAAGNPGLYAAIGNTRMHVCQMGTQNYSQSIVGLAALDRSEPLIAETGDGYLSGAGRFATFFIKNDSGLFLITNIMRTSAGAFHCFTHAVPRLQQIEYRRTGAFDRTQFSRSHFLQ